MNACMHACMPGEADKGKARTAAGTDIYCAHDLYYDTEKGPHDPEASMLSSHFTAEETEAQKG